jgi:hypothetical protein
MLVEALSVACSMAQVGQSQSALHSWVDALDGALRKLGSGSEGRQLADVLCAAWQRIQHRPAFSTGQQGAPSWWAGLVPWLPRGSQANREAGQATEELLLRAREAAAHIERSWEATGQAAQQRLESAQAAATRSCACLACSNLAIEGGPAAGEGKGSLRCSSCKVAWYCSTVCSHAD